jgi:hypothetical protein
VETVQHVTDNSLERFAMQTLPNSESGPLVDHLLMCPECQERLDAEIDFVAAMREAAVKIRQIEKP